MIYLKAADEATFNQALVDAGWTEEITTPAEEEGGEETTTTVNTCYTATHSLDVIGVIYVETGNTLTHTDEDGNTFEYPETAPIDGYHANLLLHGEEIPEALADFVIEAPANPVRKFA
jgi:hypothetical protein